MLNEDLFTAEDLKTLQSRIVKLEKIVADFRKYDEERKQYYKDIVVKAGQLEAYLHELEDADEKVKLISRLKKQIVVLNAKRYLSRIEELSDEETIRMFNVEGTRHQNKELQKENKALRERNNKLVYEKMKLIAEVEDMKRRMIDLRNGIV